MVTDILVRSYSLTYADTSHTQSHAERQLNDNTECVRKESKDGSNVDPRQYYDNEIQHTL